MRATAPIADTSRLTLRAGAAALDLVPGLGGAIAALTLAGVPVLGRAVPASPRHRAAGIAVGCYPLLPVSNRIAGAAFDWNGTTHRLAPNFADGRTAIHGNAWQRAWRIAEAGATHARLVLDHDPADPARAAEWPFAYRAEQEVALSPDGLTLTLSLANRDARPAPAGMGLHPFFARAGATLRAAPARAWLAGADGLPAIRIPVPRGWDCRTPRAVDTLDPVDTCFELWDGTAEIDRPGLRVRLAADPVFSHMVLMARPDRDTFAVEPVTHIVDAVNRPRTPGHGLATLPPGGRLTGRVHFGLEVRP